MKKVVADSPKVKNFTKLGKGSGADLYFVKNGIKYVFDIKTVHHNDVLRALYERECDLAICYDPPNQTRLRQKQLAIANLVLIARSGVFARGLENVAIADLQGMEMVSVTGSGPIGDIVKDAFAKARVQVQDIVSVSTYYIAASLVRFGSGVAIVDEFTAHSLASQGLERFPLLPDMRFGIHAAWLEDRPLSKLGLQFVAAVENALKFHDKTTTNP